MQPVSTMTRHEPRTGLVLSGAAALGAYEAGVAHYIATDIARARGDDVRFDVISGTSAGGINAAALASTADAPASGAARLCEIWSSLELGRFLRPSAAELLRILLEMKGGVGEVRQAVRSRLGSGGLLDAGALEHLLSDSLPIGRIGDNVRSGNVQAVALSTTHVASGEAVVFYQAACDHPPWPAAHGLTPRPTTLQLSHVLASAAIPILLPAVSIDGELYCDGGLRQLVPLSPAIHMGASRLVVIPPMPRPAIPDPGAGQARGSAVTSPVYLAGKALNAFFADRVDADLSRLEQINDLLECGRQCVGAAFEADLHDELARAGAGPLHRVNVLRIEPSQPLGALAVDHVTSRGFARRQRNAAGRLLRCLADGDPSRSGDLLSYLLFDGGFAADLIDLGRADARARHGELCAFLADPPVHGLRRVAR